jgi:hypothetical protein
MLNHDPSRAHTLRLATTLAGEATGFEQTDHYRQCTTEPRTSANRYATRVKLYLSQIAKSQFIREIDCLIVSQMNGARAFGESIAHRRLLIDDG